MAIRAICVSFPVLVHAYEGPGFIDFLEAKRRPFPRRLIGWYSDTELKIQETRKRKISNEERLDQIYGIVNEDLLRKGYIGLRDLRSWTEEYAKGVAPYLEKEVLDPIAESRRKEGGLQLAVIGPTSANEGVVRELLKQGGYSGTGRDGRNLFDIAANGIEKTSDGNSTRHFSLDINGGDSRRGRLIAEIEKSHLQAKLQPEEVAFVGFSEEDKGCMDYVKEKGGRVIVYSGAAKEFKEKTAEAFGSSIKPYLGGFWDVVSSLEKTD